MAQNSDQSISWNDNLCPIGILISIFKHSEQTLYFGGDPTVPKTC